MLSRPQLRLLSVLAVLVAITEAGWIDNKIFARQDSNSVSGTAPVQSSTSQSATVSVTPSVTPSNTPTSSTQSSITTSEEDTPTTSPSSTPTSTSASSTSRSATSSSPAPSSTSSSQNAPTSSSSSRTSSPVTRTSQSVLTTTSQSVNIITTVQTISGSLVTSTSASTSDVVMTATTAVLSTATSEPSSGGGMSSGTRNTIIGVVVGIGGAIILAGLFIVAWRIWGRKKNEDESDGLMGFGGPSVGHEKHGSTAGTATTSTASPFQSTLENYHNPARNVNASSNF